MNDVIAARAIHILAVVIWIGGVAMATTAVLPAVRRGELGANQLAAFQAIERRFVWQARIAVILVGLSGLYMVERLDLWPRFSSVEFWWLHLMVGVWLFFAIFLFLIEPLILHRQFHRWASSDPAAALAALHHVHQVLLALSLVAVFGAVAGSWGWSLFW